MSTLFSRRSIVAAIAFSLAVLAAPLALVADEPVPEEPAAPTEPVESEEPAAIALDEIVVSAGYSLNRQTPVEGVALSRDEILKLPTFADDLFRAIDLVPGTSGADVSSAFSVRGAPYQDVLVRLDGIELFEPFHLKDYSGVLSVVDPQVVDGIEIIPGAFPAPYGDRGAAVVDLTTRVPNDTRTRAGISLTTASFSRGQRFGEDDRGAGLVSLRRGWLDVVFDLVGDDEEGQEEGAPEYTDAFAKADWSVDDRTTVGVWALWADDSLSSTETEDDGVLETIDSSYGNTWLVGYGQRLWNDSSVAKARVFTGRVDRDRTASETEGDSDFLVRDVRQLDVSGVAADASFDLGSHLLDVGFEARSYSSTYDYAIDREFTNPVAGVGDSVADVFFDDTIEGESYGVWASDRWRLGDRLVAEVGLRYDRQTWLAEDDDQVSPRLALVADLGDAGVLRGGWGLAHQSHRPNELSVEDGDTAFSLAEKAEHRIVGWERPFDRWRLRVDAWERLGSDLRPRYANLFSPSVLFPEGTPDRIRIDADRSRARGVELFAQGRGGQRATWWASYAWSEVEDRIDGAWVPRAIDQTHALTLSTGFRLGRNWNLDAVWQYHTGWPITGLTARLVDGDDGPEIEPILGTLYGERVADYHRLDMRLSRTYTLDWAEMQFYVDVQNLYNQENERGFEYTEDDFLVQPDGSVLVTPTVDTWLGIVPSFGLTWSF